MAKVDWSEGSPAAASESALEYVDVATKGFHGTSTGIWFDALLMNSKEKRDFRKRVVSFSNGPVYIKYGPRRTSREGHYQRITVDTRNIPRKQVHRRYLVR